MRTPWNESAGSCALVDVDAQTWDQIDWDRCEKDVRKLQMTGRGRVERRRSLGDDLV